MITLFEKKLVQNICEYKNKKILTAFSGGIDSVALLDCLNRHKTELNITIYALHVNHGIRGIEADNDEYFCKNFCKSYNIPFISEKVNAAEYAENNKVSIEDAARKLRYDILFNVLKSLNTDYIFTAHHYNDKIETFFVKLFQGTSILNLSGFNLNSDKIVRPMLNIKKELINEYVDNYNLNHIEDSSNFDTNYLRNWIRHDFLSKINFKTHDLFRNINELQKESSELKNYFQDKISNVKVFNEYNNVIAIVKNDFDKLHQMEKKYLLSETFKNLFRLEKKHTLEALKITELDNSKRISMPNEYIFEVSYNTIRIFLKTVLNNFNHYCDSKNLEMDLEDFKKKLIISNNNDKLKIRFRKKGDIFKNKKLKDIFIDKKIDLFIRDISLVVENENEIVWVENISKNCENIKVIYGD